MIAIDVVSMLVGLAAIAVSLHAMRVTRRAKGAPSKKNAERTYGHPHPPVSYLRKRLPAVEYPLAWETWVDESGAHTEFVIQLTDLDTGKPIGEQKRVDLVWYVAINETWASYYARRHYMQDNVFRIYFAERVLEWASRMAADNRPRGPEMVDYQMNNR
ncbi:hypothetical protein [Tsukamurella soli]|uniref:Polyketide cyclase / dehydrase and lipid transport n=1 Tax=Tsukamurella soli TaxID=644556 RepID=A0ABP8JJ32_9ACTN